MLESFIFFATAIYAIIGGPSVGKTSIIDELKKSGEVTVEEAATYHIKKCQEKGDHEPWLADGFQQCIFDLQLQFEKEALTQDPKKIFSDRGFLDSLVYLKINKREHTKEFIDIKAYIDGMDIGNYYETIFYIEPHSKEAFALSESIIRCENTDESLILASAIKAIYEEHYKVVTVPGNLSIKERANFIRSHIAK